MRKALQDPLKAADVKSEAVEWLWNERIPRKMITIVGGRADQGKGLFMCFLAAVVSKSKFKGRNGKERWGRVCYSAIEDSHAIMTRPRLESAGANLNQIDLWRFRLPLHFTELEKYLLAREVDLLILDPLASHLTGGVSRHSDNIRLVTDPMADLIEEAGTACIVVEHVLKRVPQSGHPLMAIGGSSSGILAAARMAFLFGTDPGDPDRRILACAKGNIAEKQGVYAGPKELGFQIDTNEIDPVGEVPFLMQEEEETTFDAMDMLTIKKDDGGSKKMGRPADKMSAACEWLTNYLYATRKGPTKAGEIFEDAKHFGFTTKTLRAARRQLHLITDPPGGGRNCTWWLPDELITMLDQANGRNVATPELPPQDELDKELEDLLGKQG